MYGPHPINYHRTKIVLRYKGIFEQNATRILYVFDQSTKTLIAFDSYKFTEGGTHLLHFLKY